MAAAEATVKLLRLHAPAAESPQAQRTRRQVQQWLAGLSPARYGLPARAIVVVRQLKTALPALSPGSPWPDPLAALMRSAARPARQSVVGASVTAVWFSDEAELLACLARDALAARDAWWWPLLAGCDIHPARAAARWCQAPTQLPRALRQLSPGEAAAWLRAMGAGPRAEMLQALGTAYVLCDAVREWVAHDAAPHDGGPGAGGSQSTAAAKADSATPGRSGWRLQRLMCALAEDALAAASPGLAAPGWDEAGPGPVGTDPARHPARPLVSHAAGGTRGLQAAAATPTAGLPLHTDERGQAAPLGAVDVKRAAQAAPLPATPAGPVDARHSETASHTAFPVMPAAPTHIGPLRDPVPRQMHTRQAAAPACEAEAESTLDSSFGGLFFMLNVALAMGLYGDFTMPRAPGLAHSPWQFLHALGRRWGGRAYKADALAPWLQARATQRAWPRRQATWLLPASALTAAGGTAADTRPWHAVNGAGELKLWHPAGFLLARWPVRHGAEAAATQALQLLGAPGHALCRHGARPATVMSGARRHPLRLGADHLHDPPHDRPLDHPTDRPHDHLADLAPCLAHRLALALGLPRPAAAVALAIRLRARVKVRPGHMDLHFALSSLPLALRLAGLDRDPGWVPAAGCDFRFHFH